MKTEKRRITLVAVVVMSLVMAAFASICVWNTDGSKIYAATNEKFTIIPGRKKLIVGMSDYMDLDGAINLKVTDLTWKSSNKKVLVVNSTGRITAKKTGTATITAVSKKNNKRKASCKIVVVNSISGTYKKTKWKLNKKGTLEVTGTGNMYTKGKMPPWFKYNDFVKSAKIEVKGATNLSKLFMGCYSLESVNLSKLDTSKVTDMSYMFGDVEGTKYGTDEGGSYTATFPLRKLDVSGFDTSKVTDMNNMFSACEKVKKLDVSGFNTSKVTNMYRMFAGCNEINQLNLSSFDTSKVTNMAYMFGACRKITELDLSGFDTSKVTNMSQMFYHCDGLKELNLDSFDTSEVTNMFSMFSGCFNLKKLDLCSFNTSKVTKMSSMFETCRILEELNLSSFDMSNVTNTKHMLTGCKNLNTIYTPKQSTEQVIQFPEGTWKNSSGQIYTTLPVNATESIVLIKAVES